jgi:predicted dehydrogenase/NADPH:quinone reductase-like Zn-dependent oxidoreductase
VSIPKNMLCRIPDDLPFDSAAFVGLGSVALHGVRLGECQVGDRVAVIGLGLLGLLAVQILKASGARVLALDLDSKKVALARELGADIANVIGESNLATTVKQFTGGAGVDAVLIYAGTKSNDPLNLSADIARDRAKIIAIGAVGLDVPREAFFHKELSLTVSRSWGPGVEDSAYELKGVDYPVGYVRWTSQRNMQAFLEMVRDGKIDVQGLITHRYKIDDAITAYQLITGERKEPYIGIILEYPAEEPQKQYKKELSPARGQDQTKLSVGFVGAGLFAKAVLLPVAQADKSIKLTGLSTASGISASHSGEKFGFEYISTDYRDLINDKNIDSVFVATRHNLHSGMSSEFLNAGKNVFVEKPLATTTEGLAELVLAVEKSRRFLMIGFNRRYAPLSKQAKELLGREMGPMSIVIRINAGDVPENSWVQDSEEGAGRVIGEVCHYIDLAQYFAGALVKTISAEAIVSSQNHAPDTVHVNAELEDGSIATIVYTSLGHKGYSRERFEIFRGNAACVLDNFTNLTFVNPAGTVKKRLLGVDRGYKGEIAAFVDAVKDPQEHPCLIEEDIATTLATFAIEESIKTRSRVSIDSMRARVWPDGR